VHGADIIGRARRKTRRGGEMAKDEEAVPAFYQKLGDKRDTYYSFDGTTEAWLWKDLLEESDRACIESAARIIEVYTEIGSYPPSGEDFHHLAVFMGGLRWLTWGGVEELEGFLADNRPEIERRVREIHAQRVQDAQQQHRSGLGLSSGAPAHLDRRE
jgi:hypothetical protein